MRLFKLILLVLIFTACNAPSVKNDSIADSADFELRSVIINTYKQLTLAEGIEAEVLDSLQWPSTLIEYKGGYIIGQNPNALSGDFKENPSQLKTQFKYVNIPENERIHSPIQGFPTAMCEAPWGGILIATSGVKRFEKGSIYHFNNGVLTRLEALGASCFTGITAHQTPNGKAIIYYTDYTLKNSNLYKFVADSGSNCNNGVVYAAMLPKSGWRAMDCNLQPALKKKYKSNINLLANLNEATRVSEYISQHPLTAVFFDKNDGTIKYALMPQNKAGYLYGSIDFLFEDDGKYDGTSFHNNTILMSAANKFYSHPAEFTIDNEKGIWINTGIPAEEIDKETYKSNGGNALILVPKKGPQSNLVLRLAIAPEKGRFSGIILDKKQNCIFTTLQDEKGKGVLLKLTGPSVEKLLE